MSEHRDNAFRLFQEGDYEGAFREATASTAFNTEEYKQFIGQCRNLIAEQYRYLIAEAVAEGDYAKASSLRALYREKYGASPMIDEISIPPSPYKAAPSSSSASSGKSSGIILAGVVVVFALIAVIIAVTSSDDRDEPVSARGGDSVATS